MLNFVTKTFFLLILLQLVFSQSTTTTVPEAAYNGEDIFDIFTVEDKKRLNDILDLTMHAGRVNWNSTFEVTAFNRSAFSALNYVITAVTAQGTEVIPIVYNTSAYQPWLNENLHVRTMLNNLLQLTNQSTAEALNPATGYRKKIKLGLDIYRLAVKTSSALGALYMKQEEVYLPHYVSKILNNTMSISLSLLLTKERYTFEYMNKFVDSFVPDVNPQDLARLFIFISGIYSQVDVRIALEDLERLMPPQRYRAFLSAFTVLSPN